MKDFVIEQDRVRKVKFSNRRHFPTNYKDKVKKLSILFLQKIMLKSQHLQQKTNTFEYLMKRAKKKSSCKCTI